MRSLQSVSAAGNGEKVVTTVPDSQTAYEFTTNAVVTADTLLLGASNDGVLQAGFYADGSGQTQVLNGAPPAVVQGQWWVEDDGGGNLSFVIRDAGSNKTIVGGGSGTLTGVTANAGLLGGGTSGNVGIEVDFTQVAAFGHNHDITYLRLDGANTMSGRLTTIDGNAASPAVGGADLDTGLFFAAGSVGVTLDGVTRMQAGAAGLTVGNYTLPYDAPTIAGQLLSWDGADVSWGQLSHAALTGVGPNDHHNRQHGMASTSDHVGTPDTIFYADTAGDVQELALGSVGTILQSNGPGAAPTWVSQTNLPAEAPLPTVGYAFAGAADTGFASDGSFLYSLLDGNEILRQSPAGVRFHGNYTLPTNQPAAGATLVSAGGGIVAWGGFSHTNLSDIGEDDHHARTHSMTSVTDHVGGPWRVFFTNAGGEVQELSLGSDGQVLTSTGLTTPPQWETPSGGGGPGGGADVTNSYLRNFMFNVPGGVSAAP